MKVGKKTIYLGLILLLSSFVVPILNTQARPNHVVIDFETEFLGFISIDEMLIGHPVYGYNRFKITTLAQIAGDDCPLQGTFIRYINSYVYSLASIGVWYNSFEGTYNGEEASFEGWTVTGPAPVGYGYYFGQGALHGYLVLYTIDGSSGEPIPDESIELIKIDQKFKTVMQRDLLDFEFYYSVAGFAGVSTGDDGVTFFDDVLHYGTITPECKHPLSGDIYFACDLYLFDEFPTMTTFNSVGYGPFEFNGYYRHRPAGFTGDMSFHFEDWNIMGVILAEGTGYLEGCLILGYVSGVKDGPCYVEMSIFRIH